MNWVKNTFSDVLKCICIGSLIAIVIGIIMGLIAIISSRGNLSLTLDWTKRWNKTIYI